MSKFWVDLVVLYHGPIFAGRLYFDDRHDALECYQFLCKLKSCLDLSDLENVGSYFHVRCSDGVEL